MMTFLCRRQKCASTTCRIHNRASESSYRGREVMQCHSLDWVFPWSFGFAPRLHLWWFLSSHWLWICITLIICFVLWISLLLVILWLTLLLFIIFTHYLIVLLHVQENCSSYLVKGNKYNFCYLLLKRNMDGFFFTFMRKHWHYYKKHLFFVRRSLMYYLWILRRDTGEQVVNVLGRNICITQEMCCQERQRDVL